MQRIVRWAVGNSPSMNTLMIAILVIGVSSLFVLRRETFPKFDIDMVLTTVVYPGASPEEVERGICQKIEEAVRSIEGMKKVFSVAREGSGFVICELKADVDDPQRVLDEVRSAVDRIPGFPPKNAEDPEIKQIYMPTPAVRLALVHEGDVPTPHAPMDEPARRRRASNEWQLRQIAEQIQDELLQLPSVTLVDVLAAKPYQIDVEIPETTLRKYGASLAEVGALLAKQNIDLPAGTFRTPSGEYRFSGRNQRLTGQEIAELQAIPGHKDLTVGRVGKVFDWFEDLDMESTVNGQRALCLEVSVNKDEDLLQVVEEVKDRVHKIEAGLPPGYKLLTWFDQSEIVKDRISLLTRNGVSGLILVFLVLSVFLNIRLAFWVALGIPVSVLGACGVMLYADQTINMLSMFAFVMGLGIVVDDAIVIGENIYKHRERGKSGVQAAIDGTIEVAPSVIASVATTIIAFVPLLYVSGVMGKFMAVIPMAVIAMLVISLVESMIILPCHLAHSKEPSRTGWHGRFRRRVEASVDWVIQRLYQPLLRRGLAYPAVVFSLAAAALLVVVGLVQADFTPFEYFPKLDSNLIQCRIEFADGTPAQTTEDATRQIETTLRAIAKDLQTADGEGQPPEDPLVRVVYRTVGHRAETGPVRGGSGGHFGELWVELMPTERRQALGRRLGKDLNSQEILRRWRKESPTFAGVESLSFGAVSFGPAGKPIEFKLVGPDLKQLGAAAKFAIADEKSGLRSRAGVFDISDDSRAGKWEFRLKKNSRVRALNISEQDLYQDVRARYYGHEVMRVQRGRHEVKLMVRTPRDERRSLAGYRDIRIPTQDGERIPITEVAQIDYAQPYSEINRIDQQRSVTVTADVDADLAGMTADAIVTDLKKTLIPKLHTKYPGINVRWEGQRQQRDESLSSMGFGFLVAMFAMYVLLTLEFRSYIQPLIILVAIPFGLVGAVVGHLAMGLTFTIMSGFGLVALAGVVANDSIVLVDFINRRLRDGMPLKEALADAGASRFRPVMLTSITTVAGLAPIMMERSLQAQVLIPMAVSLAFGLMMATVWVLFLVPALYLAYARSHGLTGRLIDLTRRSYGELWARLTRHREHRAPSGKPGKTSTAQPAPGPAHPVDGDGVPEKHIVTASVDGDNGANVSSLARIETPGGSGHESDA